MEEQDMIDNAAEPNLDNENDQTTAKEATERITTKFLTKYERGTSIPLLVRQQSPAYPSIMIILTNKTSDFATIPGIDCDCSPHPRHSSASAEHGSTTNGRHQGRD